jgi:hypothetical protein
LKVGRNLSFQTIAQSFSPFLAQDGRQVCRPSWIRATSLCYILLNKFVALVGSGQRTCRPSCDEKGLKDWAINWKQVSKFTRSFDGRCLENKSTESYFGFSSGLKFLKLFSSEKEFPRFF